MGRQAMSSNNKPNLAITEPAWVRRLLIGAALLFLGIFLFVPLAAVFTRALEKGFDVYAQSLKDPDALAAVRLTLIAAAASVVLNLVFGLAAAWAIGKFEFFGRNVLITL